MGPLFQLMQSRIDTLNRVLREQITGIRVVRAFVREPAERRRFAAANDDLTEVALSTGRLPSATTGRWFARAASVRRTPSR